MGGAVAARADVAQLVDEIDEEEQRQEGEGDEDDGRDDVGVDAGGGPSSCGVGRRRGGARRRRRRRRSIGERRMPFSRHHSSASASTNAPPCSRRGAPRRGSTAPGADPGLRQVDQVVVDEEGEQREQQVPVARTARVRRRHADAQQQQVGGGRARRPRRQASSPWLGARRVAQQLDVARRAAAALGGRMRTRSPAWRGRSRSATASSRRWRVFCSLRWPLLEHQEAVVALALDRARCAPRSPTRRGARGDDEDVAAGGRRRARSPSMKNTRWPSPEVWNWPGATRARSERRS